MYLGLKFLADLLMLSFCRMRSSSSDVFCRAELEQSKFEFELTFGLIQIEFELKFKFDSLVQNFF